MAQRDFPYFHVEQTTRVDLSRELLLGVMSTGLRMVKLGLYDPVPPRTGPGGGGGVAFFWR